MRGNIRSLVWWFRYIMLGIYKVEGGGVWVLDLFLIIKKVYG